VDDGPAGCESGEQDGGNAGTLHPMKGLGQRDHAELPVGGREGFGPPVHPMGIATTQLLGPAPGLFDHPGVRVHADHLVEETGQDEGQRAGTAAGIEESSCPVEPELTAQHEGDRVRVRQPARRVEGRAALVQRRIPRPPSVHRTK
jgi:hypothetical protein